MVSGAQARYSFFDASPSLMGGRSAREALCAPASGRQGTCFNFAAEMFHTLNSQTLEVWSWIRIVFNNKEHNYGRNYKLRFKNILKKVSKSFEFFLITGYNYEIPFTFLPELAYL
jgi:hypothetical protein